VGIFENLTPELTHLHKELRREGIKTQREALEKLVVRWSGLISSAIRSEMVTTGCTYETACVRLVQECDRFTANMYYCDMGAEKVREEGGDEKAA
jgi:hypothetical protein